ncbi:hypothetical protein MTO96_005384 [Rhipicephalus appendiculatus]
MLRRLARERREYLYRKSIEDKRRTIEEKKERLKQALEENRPIPYELREEALNLQRALDWDDPGGEGVVSHEDDEYRWAGVRDPKIVVTTSRDPSSKLKQFAKEIRLIFPNAQRMNRGGYEMKQLIEACRANEVTDFIVVHETRGNPDGLVPTPHLIFHNFKTRLGKRVVNILKYLFPVPKEDSHRVVTFANQDDYISFRHHTFKKEGKDYQLQEVGPRFELKLYEIKLGTLDAAAALDVEWSLRPYMNTAKKRRFLSDEDAFDKEGASK